MSKVPTNRKYVSADFADGKHEPDQNFRRMEGDLFMGVRYNNTEITDKFFRIRDLAAGIDDGDATNKKQLDTVEATLNTNITTVENTLQDNIDNNQTIVNDNITDLEQVIDSNDSDYQQQLDDLNGDITVLGSTDTSHQSQITALQNQDSTHQSQITALQSQDTTHTNAIATNASAIATNVGDISVINAHLAQDDASYTAIVKQTASLFYNAANRNSIFGLPDNASASTTHFNGGVILVPVGRTVIHHFVIYRQIDFSGVVNNDDTIFAETFYTPEHRTLQWVCGNDEMRAPSKATIVYTYQTT